MSDWDFEASADGANWDVLHSARKDVHILRPSEEEFQQMKARAGTALTNIVEETHRHTWEVTSSKFYRHFRFSRPTQGNNNDYFREAYGMATPRDHHIRGTIGDEGRILFSNCLHGVGFELYGEVKASL